MKRPTIPDLAKAARVSISTVNRVINQPDSVRATTREHVLQVAQQIEFYGIGTLQHSIRKSQETFKLGVLLQQPNRPFYRKLGNAIETASNETKNFNVDLTLEYLEDLSPERVAEAVKKLGETCQAVSLVAAQHPLVAGAIDEVIEKDVPVMGLITPLYARNSVGFVGIDSWKVGRTAAWAFCNIVKEPGKIGVLVGNHRYRNQELNESGFRSYLREHNQNFTMLEPLSTYESAAAARELTEELLRQNPDLCGLFISGGGITGALSALRDTPKRNDFVAVGYELFDETRTALIDGTLTMAISHPINDMARETVETMVAAIKTGTTAGAQRVALGFDIYTSENV